MLGKRFADHRSTDSVATRLRRKRFDLLVSLIEQFRSPVQILDIGGRAQYWESMLDHRDVASRIHVTLLNLEPIEASGSLFTVVIGDGTRLPQYADAQFDIVFSNSTIEHVGSRADQRRMASEVRRVGKAYCVQTPNRYFPIEPHFLFPFFQFLPESSRAWLVRNFRLGWYARVPDRTGATELVRSIDLLSRQRVLQCFPDAELFEEKYLGMVKSFVAYRGPSSG